MPNENQLINQYITILDNLYNRYINLFQNQSIGVFVSGGIDSSLIAYFTNKYFKNFSLFTLHSKTGLDLNYVKLLNNLLKKNLIIVDFDKEKLEKIKPTVLKILTENKIETNPTQLSLASALYFLCEKAKQEKTKIIFTGQGPDILLGGYHMYQKLNIKNLNEKIKDDLPLLEVDKKRDGVIAQYFNIQLINPYLEKEFVDFSLSIPAEFKINKINDQIFEKYLSRKVGEYLNLPKNIITRHKKALQYSTKIRKYI